MLDADLQELDKAIQQGITEKTNDPIAYISITGLLIMFTSDGRMVRYRLEKLS